MVLGKFCWFASANSTCRGILLAGLLAAPAAAQSVTLDVEGEIEASCELSGLAGSVSGLDFSVADSTTLDFTVDCNAPFAYALESGSQAFRTVAPFTLPPLPGSGTILESVPYTVTTSFLTDGGGSFGDVAIDSATLTSANAAPCTAATFSASCPFADSGTDIAANPAGNNASIEVSWDTPPDPLLAGTYQDTLTLTVRVKS